MVSPDDQATVARAELLTLIEELPASVLTEITKAARQVLRDHLASDIKHVADNDLREAVIIADGARRQKHEERMRAERVLGK